MNRPPCFVQKQNYDSHWQQHDEWVSDCWGWDYVSMVFKSPAVETCLTPNRGPNGAKPAVFLFGDSHAQMFVPALEHAVGKDFAFVYATKPMRDCFLGASPFCKRVGDTIVRLIKPGDIVAIGFASWKMTPAVVKPSGFQGAFSSGQKYVDLIRYWSGETKKHGASVLVLGDPTVMKDKGLFCIPSPFNPKAGERCTRTRKWGRFYGKKFRDTLRGLLNQVDNTFWFDTRYLFCDDSMCDAMIPGTRTLAIGDQEHLTIEGSTYLWPFLCSFMFKNGLLPHGSNDDGSMNI